MNRREYLKWVTAATAAGFFFPSRFSTNAISQEPTRDIGFALTPASEILEKVTANRPLLSGKVPENLKQRLGAAHANGMYCLTDEPFLIEGAKKLHEFGVGAIKLWFEYPEESYPYHSDWSDLPAIPRLIDFAKHPYFAEVFDLPFSMFSLEITHLAGVPYFGKKWNDYRDYEEQFAELTAWLYEKYADRPVTFILQNWEGDWLFRNGFVYGWNEAMLRQLPDRVDRFIRWFEAKQKGVEKARKAVLEKNNPKCRVVHAVEVNQVLCLLRNVPSLTELVLPHVPVDLVSWSCYDGLESVTDLWHGLELIRHYMKSSGFFEKQTIMIGEVGFPEQEHDQEKLIELWDRTMGTFFAADIPWILHWELYCNEPNHETKKNPKPKNSIHNADELRGFWIYRPDGTLSHSGTYWKNLLG